MVQQAARAIGLLLWLARCSAAVACDVAVEGAHEVTEHVAERGGERDEACDHRCRKNARREVDRGHIVSAAIVLSVLLFAAYGLLGEDDERRRCDPWDDEKACDWCDHREQHTPLKMEPREGAETGVSQPHRSRRRRRASFQVREVWVERRPTLRAVQRRLQ
jgi:hypothetical protein|tara:strand:- start:487 stop:972 length:486 start_codon:yes stop_codon:yes gene_type:complete